MSKQRDIVIIGAGLSGSAAVFHAARLGFNAVALMKPDDPGYWARVKKLPQIPGVGEDVSGSQFLANVRKQSELQGAVFHDFKVTAIRPTEHRTFEIVGENGVNYESPVVVIASGVSKDEHFLAGEREFVGKGVYYSIGNDAPQLKHQSVAVIGKTEEAARAVLYLSRFAEKIYFVIPSSKLDVPENLVKELEGNKRIELFFSSSIKKLNGAEDLQSVTILLAGAEQDLKCRAAFIYTYNLKTCVDFAKGVVDIDAESGRIPVNSELSTSRPGIFACGDVLAGMLQNPSVTMAQGMISAINAEKYLKS